MILTKEIEVRITASNYRYYDECGYPVYIGKEIIVPLALLSEGSHYKIRCECDECGIEKEMMYKNYLKYANANYGEYNCRMCAEKKRKEALKNNYGVEYPLQNKGLEKKMNKTIKEKYGVDNPIFINKEKPTK